HGESNFPYLKSLYVTFGLLTMQGIPDFPNVWYLELLSFLLPLIGVTIIFEGVVRFSLLLFSKDHNQKEWLMALASTYRNHTILVGLGNVGYRIYEHLRSMQIDVVVIEKNEQSPFVDVVRKQGVPVITGDVRREEFLKMLGVQDARNLLAVTDDDLTNL